MTDLQMHNILVVDDELSIRESFNLILDGKYKVLTAASGEGALKTVTDTKVDLTFLDIRMPGMNGLETLKRLKELDPKLEVVMVTAVNDMQKASEAIKLGARDYLIKPFDINAVLKMSENILRRLELSAELGKKTAHLVGQSDKLKELNQQIDNLAHKSTPVLLLGEVGTEKGTISRIIHQKSPRATRPYAAIDLSPTLSAALIKIKLFGQGGGTTVAELDKSLGLIEQARGGTLFINNIELLPKDLLLSLQNIEARLIGATTQPTFTTELSEAFPVDRLLIPALRERAVDIPLIIKKLLDEYSQLYGRGYKKISKETEETLSNYPWPGNFSQLRAVIARLALTQSAEQIENSALPLDMLLRGTFNAEGTDYLSAFDRAYARTVYEETGHNRETTAQLLEVTPSFLSNLL